MNDKSPKRIVVTGANGFVGKHVVRELSSSGIEVIGIGREVEANPEIADLLSEYCTADLVKSWPVTSRVDAVIHLASLAVVGPSFDAPQDYIGKNSAMVTNMAEYYLARPKDGPRLIIVSSGAIYDPNQPMPLKEDAAINFSSPYAVSKVLVENQCQYYKNRGLDCIVARPFNHVGPGQVGDFIIPRLIEGLFAASRKKTELSVGNLDSKRDYTDVRDVARAYKLLATASSLTHTTYNVCSGGSTSGRSILEKLKDILNVHDIEVVIDESKIRPLDPQDIVGNSARVRIDTGWRPEITLEQTLVDMTKSASR